MGTTLLCLFTLYIAQWGLDQGPSVVIYHAILQHRATCGIDEEGVDDEWGSEFSGYNIYK